MREAQCLKCGKKLSECECVSFDSKKITKPIKGIEKLTLPPLPQELNKTE